MKIKIITVAITLILVGCDIKNNLPESINIEGTYTSTEGKNRLVFRPNGQVETLNFGIHKTTLFQIENNIIRYQFEGGLPRNLQILPDGKLKAETGTLYQKD